MNRTFLITVLALVVAQGDYASAHPAWGIAVDRQGRVHFADVDHGNHIWRIDGPGKLTSVVAGRHSHDLSLDGAGNLFVSHVAFIPDGNLWESCLLKFEPGGSYSTVIRPTTKRKEFWGNAFTLDREENVYFGYTNNPRAGESKDESLLLRRSPDGKTSLVAGSTRGHRDGAGRQAQFTSVQGLAWGPRGLLYVADQDAIRTVTQDSVVATLARGLLAKRPIVNVLMEAEHLFGLAVAAEGTVFVADHGGARVLKISPEGRVSIAASSERPWAPTGVAVSGDDLMILEVGSSPLGRLLGPCVRRVSADGRVTTLATVGETRK
jgi:sugar lactone lactonase YvrE